MGANFRNHPAGTPTATVLREDKTDPSTGHLPDTWTRVDEWYNYQSPINPVVNGGGDDYSPRNTEGVHVLLKMDESSYDEDDGQRHRRRSPDLVVPALRRRPHRGTRAWATRRRRSPRPGMLSHIAAGIEIAAGVLPSAACGVTATNANPVISSATATPSSGAAPLAVAFTATATDADGDTLTYTWDLDGNGTFETSGRTPTFTYTAAGLYIAGREGDRRQGRNGDEDHDGQRHAPSTGTVSRSTSAATCRAVLAFTIGSAGSFGTFEPGVAKDYTTSLAATVTSTASAATLTVRDPSAVATGHLVNGTRALASPLQLRSVARRSRRLSEGRAALLLTSFSEPVSLARGDDRPQAEHRRRSRRCSPVDTGRRSSSRCPPRPRRTQGGAGR